MPTETPGVSPPPTPEPTPVATPMPTPEPTPQPIKLEGFYHSVNGKCGIEGFNLKVSSEDNLLLMNFGDNGGNVTFAKTENSKVFQSIREGGLVIFGVSGHQCTITCGEDNKISLVCLDRGLHAAKHFSSRLSNGTAIPN